MKDSRKKSYSKIAAGLLSTVMALSILPIQSLAAVSGSIATTSENTVVSKNDDNLSNVIIREVVEERDEFSKTYLMSDGTYYTCISSVAIHQFSEDSWENIDDSLNFSPETIEEVETKFTDFAEAVKSSGTISTFALHEINPAITVQCIGNASETTTGYTLPADGALTIKPNQIINLSAQNKVLLSAELRFEIAENTFNNDTILYLKELSTPVTDSTTLDAISNSKDIYYRSYTDEVEDNLFKFDITDIYSKWERGLLNNNGVALIAPDLFWFDFEIIGTPVLFLNYKDVDANDSNFLYHTLDLGKAGIISINDVTNAYKLEQTLAGLECVMLPVTLTRTMDSSNFTLDTECNVSSEWNYGYSLFMSGNFITLTLPQGTKIDFKRPETIEATDGYEIWTQVSNEDYVDDVTMYVTSSAAPTGGIGTNYGNCYVKINGIEYWFNSLGRIKYIQKGSKRLNINYEFSNEADKFVINKLTDAVGNQYCITYSTYTVNNRTYAYASKITVKDSENNNIYFDNAPIEININNVVSNSQIISTYTYSDGTTSSYIYDFNGKLLSVTGTDGITTTLNYKSNNNLYLTGYTQTKNNVIVNEFSISSENTYERKFNGTNIEDEMQRYDNQFQLTTYHYGDNITSMSYSNGTIDSYAIKNEGFNEENNLIKNGDFSQPLSNGWKRYSTAWPEHNSTQGNVKIENHSTGTLGIKQAITGLETDKTYIFSAETIAESSIPSSDYEFIVKIEFFSSATTVYKTINLPFDVALNGQEQIRMCAFKMDMVCPVTVSIYASGNLGTFFIDNVRLYEATPEDGAVTIPGVTTSNPISKTLRDGMVVAETIRNGSVYMQQNYEYSEDTGEMLSSTDFNGVTTYFDYHGRTGKLLEKGYKLDSENSIQNPVSYSYNSTGLLKTVEQTIKNVLNQDVELLARYTYDEADRITSISNNGYRYLFTYNDVGNITNIKKETVSASTSQVNNLIDYDYSENQLGTIEYANGYKINYIYNEDGNISQINCLKPINGTETVVASYSYTYENGAIKETLMSFDDLEYDVKVVNNESSIDTYHVLNGVSTLVYSKTQNKTYTEEVYSATNNTEAVSETFKRTKETETKNGSNTELFAAFEGRKSSILNDTCDFGFEGSSNTIKDYFGRTISKSFDLEEQIIDNSTSTPVGTLSLTQNFTYKSFDEVTSEEGTRTTNLVSSTSNEITGVDEYDDTIQSSINYYYIYDDRGNIKFEYTFDDDYYILSKYYQYDEANQLVSCVGYDYNAFYLYDNNGNLTEKMLDCEAIIEGLNDDAIDFTEIPSSLWSNYNWEILDNMKVIPTSASTTIHYTYDSLGRLINYKEQDYGEDSADIDINIGYDAYGNPLKYIGEDINGQSIIADLTWNGTLLESALIYSGTTPNKKIVFEYDVNGYRINKTIYEYDNETSTFNKQQSTDYIWDNGNLMGIKVLLADECSYTNILYDTTGVPYGITTPIGFAYYFIRDVSNSVRGLVDARGNIIATMDYNEFGNINFDIVDDNIIVDIYNTLAVYYNPCTYKGYMYDYDLGMYFIKDKCYAPKIGRFLNETALENLTEVKDNPIDINTKLCCNNNMVNGTDKDAEWNRDEFKFTNGSIQVEMSKAFLSRPFCTLYASKILSESGTWDYINGRNIDNMNIERIASNLFARTVGNYAEKAVNRVNATWGDGWIVSNRNSSTINISENDTNAEKYLKIWMAAPSIKSYAIANGIYITL